MKTIVTTLTLLVIFASCESESDRKSKEIKEHFIKIHLEIDRKKDSLEKAFREYSFYDENGNLKKSK